jgi:hypothetical protein
MHANFVPSNFMCLHACFFMVDLFDAQKFGNLTGVFLVMASAVRVMDQKDADSTYLGKLAKIATSEIITSKVNSACTFSTHY